jgi:hypothetical protein
VYAEYESGDADIPSVSFTSWPICTESICGAAHRRGTPYARLFRGAQGQGGVGGTAKGLQVPEPGLRIGVKLMEPSWEVTPGRPAQSVFTSGQEFITCRRGSCSSCRLP